MNTFMQIKEKNKKLKSELKVADEKLKVADEELKAADEKLKVADEELKVADEKLKGANKLAEELDYLITKYEEECNMKNNPYGIVSQIRKNYPVLTTDEGKIITLKEHNWRELLAIFGYIKIESDAWGYSIEVTEKGRLFMYVKGSTLKLHDNSQLGSVCFAGHFVRSAYK